MFSARAAQNPHRTRGEPHANLAIAVGDYRKRTAARRRSAIDDGVGSTAG